MARRYMESIAVGAFPYGTAFGAHIYSVNVNIGQNGDPSTLELELINSDGVYNINDNHLKNSADNPFTIRIDAHEEHESPPNPSSTSLIFKSMYLVSYNQNESPTQKTLSVKFVDGGSILDKIQVAILNKQASPANIFGPGGIGTWVGFDANWYGRTTLQVLRTYSIPVKCINPCPQTSMPAWGPISANPWPQSVAGSYGQPFGFGRGGMSPPYVFSADKCAVTNINRNRLSYGGIVVIGEEEFTSSTCQIPNVTYTFYELMQLLTSPNVGLKMRNWTDRNGFSAGRPENAIRDSFSGSLKDVLNSWCSLYGLGYNWDFFQDEIVFYDLTQPVRNLEAIYNQVLKISMGEASTYGPIAISDVSRSSSIEGTYHQDDISTYMKPAKKKVIDQSTTQRVFFEPITLNHIIPYNEGTPEWYKLTGGRTEEELIISSVLAKYNENARTLYNYYLIATKSNDFADSIDNLGRPLGLNIKHKLTAQEKADIISYTFNTKDYVANSKKYGTDAGCFLGTYSKEAESKWTDWEKKIADFIGRYYVFPEFNPDRQIRSHALQLCFDRDIETKPATKLYAKKSTVAPALNKVSSRVLDSDPSSNNNQPNYYADDLPFNDLLKHPNGAVLTKMVNNHTKEPITKFRLFDRNASYGQKEEQVEPIFYKNSEEVLKDFIPAFAKLDGNQKTFLHELIKKCFPDIYNKLESIEDEDKQPCLLFLPDTATVTSALKISPLKGTPGIDLVKGNPSIGMTPSGRMGVTWPNMYGANPGNNLINIHEYKPESEETMQTPCKLMCDWDLSALLCDCPDGEAYDPDLVGLTSQYARNFYLSVPINNQGGNFILPSEYPYSAFVTLKTKLQKTEPAIKQNYGELRDAKGTMGYRVNFRDVTSDIESMDDAQEDKIGGNVMAGDEGAGQIEASVLVPGKGFMAARSYHSAVAQAYTNDMVNKSLSFTMIGLDWTPLMGFINVEEGLSGLQISYAEDGVKIIFDYATRPPELLNPENFMAKIGPKLNANSYLRTY